jgi:hypothetical protein
MASQWDIQTVHDGIGSVLSHWLLCSSEPHLTAVRCRRACRDDEQMIHVSSVTTATLVAFLVYELRGHVVKAIQSSERNVRRVTQSAVADRLTIGQRQVREVPSTTNWEGTFDGRSAFVADLGCQP